MWVILKDDEIIEKNKDGKKIFEMAEKYDNKDIIVSYCPKHRSQFYYY